MNIATFSFDDGKLRQSVDQLQNRLFELRKEQEALNTTYKQSQKEIDDLVKVNQLLTNANQQESTSFKENEARIKELIKAQRDTYKEQQNLANQTAVVRKEYNAVSQALRLTINEQGEYISMSQKVAMVTQREINSKEDAKAVNKELNAIINQLNPNIAEEAALIKELNEKLDENTQYIRENSSVYAQQKMDIGTYKEQIKAAFQEMNLFNGGLGGFIQRSKEAGGVAPMLSGGFAAIRAGIIGATQAGIAFLATPIGMAIAALAVTIGLVVGAFKFMTASMNSTEEGSAKLAKITGAVKGVFEGLWKIIKPLGEFLGTVFIAYVETIGTALSKMVDGIATALEFLGFEETAESLRSVKAEVESTSKASADLAKAELELDKAQRQSRKTQLEYQKTAEKLRQQRDDETKSVAERIALNEQLGVVLQKQIDEELRLAQVALKVANLRIKAEGETKETLDAQAEALTNIADIEERVESQRSEQLAALNGLRKEAAAQEKERQDKAREARQKAFDDAIRKMEAELEYYIASQGTKKKAMADQLAFEKEVTRQSLDILKKEYEAKKLTRREYEAAVLEIQNEYASKQTQLAIDNADIELQMFKLNNERKLEQNQFFSDELYKQELDRIKRINEAEQANLKLRLENGIINQKEYDLAMLELDKEYQSEVSSTNQQREDAIKDKKAVDLALEREADMVNHDYDMAWQMQKYQEEYAVRKKAAEDAGADMELFEKAEAAKKMAIEKAVNDNKIQLASNTLGQLASILGEESAAGKALAVMQATMDTYRSATSAYAAMVGIPIVGPALAAVAAGAAIAAGLANVKKITATKEAKAKKPSYAKGGLMEIGGNRHYAGGTDFYGTDGTQFEAEKGEMIGVLNRNASRAFMDFNNSFLRNSPASSSVIQNQVTGRNDNAQLAQVITEAVRTGAAEGTAIGSAQGITEASAIRKVIKDAEFE